MRPRLVDEDELQRHRNEGPSAGCDRVLTGGRRLTQLTTRAKMMKTSRKIHFLRPVFL